MKATSPLLPLFGDSLAPIREREVSASVSEVPTSWVWGDLPPRAFRRLIVDPPWFFKNRSEKGEGRNAVQHYGCMRLDDILALPVQQLAHRDGCLLWLWATWPMLREAIACLDAWQFRYVTGGPWHKKTRHGKNAFGTGYVLRSASEPFLIGVRGDVPYGPDARRVRGLIETSEDVDDSLLIEAVLREHSRKPDEQYRMLDMLVPDVPGAELFARQTRPGWRAWGNQSNKFNAVEAME